MKVAPQLCDDVSSMPLTQTHAARVSDSCAIPTHCVSQGSVPELNRSWRVEPRNRSFKSTPATTSSLFALVDDRDSCGGSTATTRIEQSAIESQNEVESHFMGDSA